jgi:hypothetical protein
MQYHLSASPRSNCVHRANMFMKNYMDHVCTHSTHYTTLGILTHLEDKATKV